MNNSGRTFGFVRNGVNEIVACDQFRVILLLALIHVPLGILIYNAGPLAVLHPMASLGVGLYCALQKKIRLELVALSISYIVGAEVLWRMAQIPIFWEFGKYSSSAIAIIAMVRRGHFSIPKIPLAYFLALLPACVITFVEFSLVEARGIISSILSGPFLLLICCWFFSNVKATPSQIQYSLFAIIIPLLSVAFATLFYTVTVEDLQFTDESNFATSGGFGPNQVSAMLGLGAFLSLFCLISFRNEGKHRVFLMLAAILFTAQSVMTFSRGGIYNAVGALMLVVLLEFRNPTRALRRLGPVIATVFLFLLIVFPILNNFTEGGLQARFEDSEPTHRVEIVGSDLLIFAEHPLFGAGVGIAYSDRERFLEFKAMSHTEFSRLISEHGMFGFFAILMLGVMIVENVQRQHSALGLAVVIGLTAWCVLFTLNAGTRLAAPSFIWGIAFVTLIQPKERSLPMRR